MTTAYQHDAALTTPRLRPRRSAATARIGAIGLVALLAGHATAQPEAAAPAERTFPDATEADSLPDLSPQRKSPTLSITGAGSFSDSAEFDSDDGDLQVSRVRALVEVALDLGKNRSLSIGFGSERSWYDFENATSLDPGGDPFGDVSDTEIFLRYSAAINEKTSWFALGAIGIAAEDDADLSDSLIYGGAVGFRSQESETFSWGLGLLVRSQLDDDPLIVPLPQIRWAISDRWTLESQRAGLRLGYTHCDDLSYGLQAEFVSRTFRLDENGPIPNGVATDRRVPVSFFASYRPTRSVSLVANIGAAVLSNIELLDDAGNDLADDDLEAALFFSLSARISF